MTTYRTGNHWGVTIVREAEHDPNCHGDNGEHWTDCECPCHDENDGAQLVAVVVNGDQALTERICALLNGDIAAPGYALATQVLRGVAERSGSDAARWAADYLEADPDRHLTHGAEPCPEPNVHVVDRGAPETGLRSTESAQTGPVGGSGRPEPQRRSQAAGYAPPPSVGPGCICNDPPPTVDKPKNGTASRPPGWVCPRHGTVI